MQHETDEHESQESTRGCPMHDKNGHWVDDLAYTEEEKRLPVPDNAPRFTEVISVLKENIPEGNPPVYRFALVMVNGETGLLNILAPGQSTAGATINLLSRAVSQLAFQEHMMERATNNAMRGIMGMVRRGMEDGGDELPLELPDLPGGYL